MSAWIAHLPLRHKFLLLCLVGLLMAAVPSALVLQQSFSHLSDLKNERQGMAPSRALLQLIQVTQEHRGLSVGQLSGDDSKRPAREARQGLVDQALGVVNTELASHHRQAMLAELASIKLDWQALARDVGSASITAAVSTQRHSRLIGRTLFLLEDESEASGMALDADPESYYLITAVFRDMPRLTEQLGLARARGTGMLVQHSTDAESRNQLLSLMAAAGVHGRDADRSFVKAARAGGGRIEVLVDPIQAAQQGQKRATELAQALVGAQDGSAFTSTAYFQSMTEVIQAQFALSDSVLKRLDGLFEARIRTETTNASATVAVIVVMTLLGAWLAITITRSITMATARAVQVAEALAQGDLSQTMHSEQRDEIGHMVRAMGQAVAQFRQTMAGIRSASESVATASTQIAQGNLDLSARTEHQASSLQQTASSMEEMSATVSHNALTARTANQLALQASAEATQSGGIFAQVVTKMADIKQSSARIAEINSVIDGIAFQTNILALNAAVEAARAGEQGRGFAVVATEVRHLAKRSADAAREIKALISSSVDSVEAGCTLASETGQSIDRLVHQVQKVSQMMGEIASSSEQQSLGIAQVNQAVTQLDQVTQQNAALVEESTAAAASLNDQAQRLQDAVGTFKLA